MPGAPGRSIYAGRYESATASPETGFYLETLGATLLVAVAGCGLLLAGPAPRVRILTTNF